MMIRLTGAIILNLILVIFGCDEAPKNTASPKITKEISPTTNLTEQVDKLNADLTILRDKMDSISDDYTKLKDSPALNLTDQVKKLSADMSKLKEKVDSISTKVDSISNDYTKVAFRVMALEPSNALLNTEKEGYAIANTKFGPFIITKRGMSQYLDGYKVKLGIGNFTNATFKEAKLNVTWGSQKKEFNITDELSSGAYTNIEIALAPAKTEEIKTIQVGIELSKVYLKTK